MKHGKIRFIWGGVAIFLTVVACVIPGQTISPANNENFVLTAVAGTMQSAQTQTALPQVVPTETFVGMTGTLIEQAQDGTTKYTDYDGSFEITFPVGWLAVRPNSDEFNAYLAGEGTSNSMLHDQMTIDAAEYVTDLDRLFVYIVRPDIKKDVIFGFSKVALDSNDKIILDNDTMGRLVNQPETSNSIPGFRASVVQLHTDSDVRMIEIGGRWSVSDGQGGTIPFFSTVYFFKPSSSSTVRLTFTYIQDYHDQGSQEVKIIANSIRIINP